MHNGSVGETLRNGEKLLENNRNNPLAFLCFTDLKKDPRAFRHITKLAKTWRVICVGQASPEIEGVEFVYIPPFKKNIVEKLFALVLLLSRSYDRFNQLYLQKIGSSIVLEKLSEKFQGTFPSAVCCNDLETVPLGVELVMACKRAGSDPALILDAHEYAFKEFGSWKWRLLSQGLQKYRFQSCRGLIDEMITVADGIADEYKKDTGMRPKVVTNAAPFSDCKPSWVEDNKIRMIHHGACIRERGLDKMIKVMDLLDERFSLELMLVPNDQEYYRELERSLKTRKNVRLIPPVPMPAIVSFINRYDIGLYLLQPANFNNLHALPNKFFEFVQARLCLAIGPSVEMANLIKKHGLGIVADDFSSQSMARALKQLTVPQVRNFKQQTEQAASQLSAEANLEVYESVISETIERKYQELN